MSTEHRAQSTEHRAQSTEHRAQSQLLRKIVKGLRNPFWSLYYVLTYPLKILLRHLLKKKHLEYLIHKGKSFSIPIYIISFNRLEYVSQMLNWLEAYGYKNIIIIDNNSNYQPLLDFYKTCGHKVIYMKKNYGHTVFFDSPRFFFSRLFSFFVLTDPDLAPIEDCPNDFVEQFMRVMADYPEYQKVGFSIKIDDLPTIHRGEISWESQFWKYSLEFPEHPYKIYHAGIDTTFALNSPAIYTLKLINIENSIRTGIPYQSRHLPWYVTALDDEDVNYVNSVRTDISSWSRYIYKRINGGA